MFHGLVLKRQTCQSSVLTKRASFINDRRIFDQIVDKCQENKTSILAIFIFIFIFQRVI